MNIRKFIVTVLQENKIEGAEFDESGVPYTKKQPRIPTYEKT